MDEFGSSKRTKRKKVQQEAALSLMPGETVDDYLKARDYWNKQLKNSGFVDIEFFNKEKLDFSGSFTQYHGGTSNISSRTMAERYDQDVADMYGRYRTFLAHYNWSKLPQRLTKRGLTPRLAKRVWADYSEGVAVNDIARKYDKYLSVSRHSWKRYLTILKAECSQFHRTHPMGDCWSDF